MADDTWDVEQFTDFHPCNRPHGMKDYVLKDLTEEQQLKLNQIKTEQVRSNNQYLAKHPEIRGLIMMILRILMRARPTLDVHETIAKYFVKSSVDIKEEVYAYLENREKLVAQNSFVLQKEAEEEQQEIDTSVQDGKTKSKLESSLEFKESEVFVKEESLLEEEESIKSETLLHKEINEILNLIIDNVIAEADVFSIGSIASLKEYEDHDVRESSSSSSSSSSQTSVHSKNKI